MDSLPQSRQAHSEELVGHVGHLSGRRVRISWHACKGVVGFAGFRAAVEDVDALRGLFTSVWFWTWETTVPRHDTAEASLTPAEPEARFFFTRSTVWRVCLPADGL